ncbi:MAG: methionine adenosyltransferase [Proteobacteria bacterium]|nr:methionine adenosyltransferase [Pseudomonadota bacterium]
MQFVIGRMARPGRDMAVEVVERKGLGHPDTICDALAEAFSRALGRFYLERFGRILHHNLDKALLWGGAARPRFGGGEVLAPIEIFLAGRAVTRAGDVEVPVEELAHAAVAEWIGARFRALDPARHLRVRVLIRPGSVDLGELFAREHAGAAPLANDTSCGVGYAPLTPLEGLVIEVERRINDPAFRARHPESGEDVKVMAVRRGRSIRLTVARAFIDRHLADLEAYVAAKSRLASAIEAIARARGLGAVAVDVNTADDPAAGAVYLTVTGTSAEAGDDGQVGRGNRVNGVIAPLRPMSLEAAAGKNPVTHVGKLYNLAARAVAEEIVAELPEAAAAECCLVSQIGRRIDDPQLAQVRIALARGGTLAPLRPRIQALVRANLAGLAGLWRRVIAGEVELF